MKSAQKSRSGRSVGVRNRRLVVEGLETRDMLSGIPILPATAVMPTWRPAAPDFWVQSQQIARQTLQSDGPTVAVARFSISENSRTGIGEIDILKSVQFSTLTSVPNAVAKAELRADFDPRVPGCETVVATTSPVNGVISFNRIDNSAGAYFYPGQKVSYELAVTPGKYVAPRDTQIGFRLNSVVMADAFTGQPVAAKQMHYSGPSVSYHTLRAAAEVPATLRLTLNGPTSQIVAPEQRDIVLANVSYTANEPEVITQYVLIEGQNAEGHALTNTIADTMEDVSLRNTATGRVVQGVRLTGVGDLGVVQDRTYQVYRFDNFVADTGQSTWQLNVDFHGQDAIPSGAQFRAWVNVASTQTVTCGILPASNRYDLTVRQLDSGGKVNVTPAGGALASNVVTVVHPHLSVMERSGPSTDTVVENQKNVTIVRMDVHANEVRDLLLTRVVVGIAEGSMLNGTNYTFWVDTDGNGSVDTILQDGVASQFNQVDFNNLPLGGFIVGKDGTVRMEVHMDVVSSFTSTTFRAEVLGVEVERVDNGSSVNWDIFHTPQTLFSCVSQGDIFVTQSQMMPSRQVLGGALSDPLLGLRFHAESEDVDVTDLQISAMAGQGQSVDSYELWVDGIHIATSQSPGSADVPPNTQVFTLDNKQLVVPKGSDVVGYIRARMKADYAGGVSGEPLQLWMSGRPIANDSMGAGSVRARGVESSNNLVANDGDTVAEGEIFIGTGIPGPNHDIVGSVNTVVMSKLLGITNADPATGVIPTGVAEIGAFTFTAAANVNSKDGLNRVDLDVLTFEVNASNVALDTLSFALMNRADSSRVAIASTVVVTPTGYTVTFTDLVHSGVYTAIGSGASATFALKVNVTNPNTAAASGGESSLQTAVHTNALLSYLDEDFGTSVRVNGAGLADDLVLGTLLRG